MAEYELQGLFYDIEAFVRSLVHIFTEHVNEIRVLFNSNSEAIDCIEQEILDIYIHPETQPNLLGYGDGSGMLDMRLFYTVPEAKAMLSSLGSKGTRV